MKIKRDPLDVLFSQYIRLRDGKCMVCNRVLPFERLECSHFFSRRHIGTRWDDRNACAKCFTCHQRMTGDPVLFSEWIQNYLGEEEYERLRLRMRTHTKFTAFDKAVIKAELQKKIKQLQARGSVAELIKGAR